MNYCAEQCYETNGNVGNGNPDAYDTSIPFEPVQSGV